MLAAGVALSCGAGLADDVSTTIQSKNGKFNIDGRFKVKADPSVVWDVLTSYEQIPRFVGSLKKSHVQEDLGVYHFLLEQEFEGGFLFFTQRVRVLLDVREVWYQHINFIDIKKKDFAVYQGSWSLTEVPQEGLEIDYQLEAKPNFDAPFVGDFMNGGAKDLLKAVRREILRRQKNKDLESTPRLSLTKPSTPGPLKQVN
jgi:hypothetical protein